MRNHVGAAKNHIAMQHAEVRKQRRKLIANERCESARIIERVGCCLDSLPGRFRQIQAMGFVGAEVRVPECRPRDTSLKCNLQHGFLIHACTNLSTLIRLKLR